MKIDAFIESTYMVSRHRDLVQDRALKLLKSKTARMPDGYDTFMETVGRGELTTWVRVYDPERIASQLAEWRQRIEQFWFWDDAGTGISQERALEACVFADTYDGDEFIVHPDSPNDVFVLPRHEDQVLAAGTGFASAMIWAHEKGITPPLSFRYFDCFLHRESIQGTFRGGDPEIASLRANEMVAHSTHVVEEGELCCDLFVPDIGGRVSIFGAHGAAELDIAVNLDSDANPEARKALVETMTQAGAALAVES